MGFFDSPRERAGKDLYGGQLRSYDDLLNQVSQLQSSTSGINNADSLKSAYGLTSGSDAFGAARRNLASQRARSLSSASSRMSGTNATPEMTFGGIEGNYANAAGNIESQASQADIDQQRFIAQLLSSIQGRNDQFGLQKAGTQSGIMGGKANATQGYLGSLSDASTFDDILSAGGALSKIYSGFFPGDAKKPS